MDSLFNNKTITYNFGIPASAIRFQTVYLQKVILPKTKPDFVIWNINPKDFWNWIMISIGEANLLGTPMGRDHTDNTSGPDFYGNVNQFLLHVSALYKYRGFFVPPWFDFSIYWGLIGSQSINGYWPTLDRQDSSQDTMIVNQPGIVPNAEGYPVLFDNLSATQFLDP